jgi:hypothetical protein
MSVAAQNAAFNLDGGTAMTSGIEWAKWCCLSPVAVPRF